VEDAENQEKIDNPHTLAYKHMAYIPDTKLKEDTWKAKRLLGMSDNHPMGWVIIPHTPNLPEDQWLKAGAKFSDYPAAAVKLLQPELMNKSLSGLTGANPELSARTVITNMGGGGYEANGEFGALNVEHVNFATVVHEMGHHKQNKEQGFSEQSINQVKGLFPILDLHNILISENKIAARELKRDPKSDPYVRLRYTEAPIRLRVSDWKKLAKDQNAESENYRRFKERLAVKDDKVNELLLDIEAELQANPELYPGKVPTLFKNFMVDEIIKKGRGSMLEMEKGTDIGHK
jgi:hypothetical protein